MNNYKPYFDKIPPCGIFCGLCPNYVRTKNKCGGQNDECEKRKCKSIYLCCTEKRGHMFCNECSIFPCARFKAFAKRWKKHGQDLIKNQELLQQKGEKLFLYHYNAISNKTNE